jgi:hypothetical protein
MIRHTKIRSNGVEQLGLGCVGSILFVVKPLVVDAASCLMSEPPRSATRLGRGS